MLRLGLDLGTNSVGWALYRLGEDGDPEKLVDGGVLIHSDGRDPRSRASNAAGRREQRGPRRNRDRMLRRRRRVARLLRARGLLPDPADGRERARLRNLDPLRLRAEALRSPLAPHELGRALLSFVDRRGFRSNRRTDGGEDGAIRTDVRELDRRIAQSGARTLGEYLWRRRSRGRTIRARLGNGLYPARAMVERELAAIRAAQAPRCTALASADWDAIADAILFQRELRPVDRGRCTLIPSEERIDKAHPLFQRFRIRQEVLNVEVATPGDRPRPLEREERERLVAMLLDSNDRTFARIVAGLALPEGTRVNLRSAARDRLDGDQTAKVLRAQKCFGRAGWAKLSLDRQQELVERLLADERSEDLEAWLRDEFGLSGEATEAVAAARLPQGTGNLSKAAIERLLPHLRDGKRYHEAVDAAGLGHHSDFRGSGDRDRLPYYGEALQRHVVGGGEEGGNEAERWGRIANPTVHIALGQVRRLFNAVADRYGKPDEVVVELARELKQTEEDRLHYQRRQNEHRERNERLREAAAAAGHPDPSPRDMRKLRLWEEQGAPAERVCPYTGEALSIGRVLSDETEIEHILPRRPSFDDSMNNQVLALTSANREKGNRTPFEAWGGNPERYAEILGYARSLPQAKQWRFTQEATEQLRKGVEEGGFLARHLNETRYLSLVVREYLEAAVEPNRVWVTPGRLTAMLRHAWGLNGVLSDDARKNRDDHRHHLVDAAVVGLISRSLLQRVATESGRGEDIESRVVGAVEPPWEGFRQDVAALADRCIVRHRPDHFRPDRRRGVTTGSLHNETAYGIVEGPDERGVMTLVETKPLDALDPKRLDDVRDPALRDKLRALWARAEAEGGKPAEQKRRFAERARRELGGVRRVRVLTRLGEDSLAFVRDAKGRVYKAYKTDGNAYMDVWLLPGGKTVGETVSRYDAHQPDFRSKVKAAHPTARKLMRLHVNDMIATRDGDERRILRVQALTGERIVAVDHNEGGDLRRRERDSEHPAPYKPLTKSAGQMLQIGLRKIAVDELGRVRDGGPFGPDGRDGGGAG